VWLPISVAGEDDRYVSTPVEEADEDDENGSLLASMGILFFGTIRQRLLSVPCMFALRPLTRVVC
jgi:hypothetical protein